MGRGRWDTAEAAQGGKVPEPQGGIRRAADQRGGKVCEGDTVHGCTVSLERCETLARGEFPEPYGMVFRAGSEVGKIVAEACTQGSSGVSTEGDLAAGIAKKDHLECVLGSTLDQGRAQGIDRKGFAVWKRKARLGFALRRGPHADDGVCASGGEKAAIAVVRHGVKWA